MAQKISTSVTDIEELHGEVICSGCGIVCNKGRYKGADALICPDCEAPQVVVR